MPKVVGYFGVGTSMKAFAHRLKDRKLMRHTQLRELIIVGSKMVVQGRGVGKRNDLEHFQKRDAKKA